MIPLTILKLHVLLYILSKVPLVSLNFTSIEILKHTNYYYYFGINFSVSNSHIEF